MQQYVWLSMSSIFLLPFINDGNSAFWLRKECSQHDIYIALCVIKHNSAIELIWRNNDNSNRRQAFCYNLCEH